MPDVKLGMYKIDCYGNIYSNYKNAYRKPSVDKDGYLKICLSTGDSDKPLKHYRISRLVAIVFIGNPPEDMSDDTINHIDGNIKNNHISNLEWMDRGLNSSIRQNKGQGETNSFYDKHHSTKTKEYLRKINIGKKYSQEINDKKARYGSENAASIETIVVNNVKDVIKFQTIKEAARFLNLSSCSLYANGKLGNPKHYCKKLDVYIYTKPIYENQFGSTGIGI